MSEQALDLRRSLQIVRRHKTMVGIFAAIGLLAGAGYTALNPPTLASTALVVLPPSTHDMATQVIVADSAPVLEGALRSFDSSITLQTLHGYVHISSLTANVISITAKGTTPTAAEDTANAVAASYIDYVSTTSSPTGKTQAQVLQKATSVSGTPLPIQLLITAGLGALLGVLIGGVCAIAVSRSDRRLRERDEIADAIGVPVLASIPVWHPRDAARWTRLLEEYEPTVVHAWRLRNALHLLGLADAVSAQVGNGGGSSLAVLSLASDAGALALGPQLAVFAASLGIPTTLVVGARQDRNAVAALHAACAAPAPRPSTRPPDLRVIATDDENITRQPTAMLTIVAAVVDERAPQVEDTMPAKTTVLGVSAGAATAAQLARVALSAAADKRRIDGILVADPDPADHTTGRIPQLARPTHRRKPTRLTGVTTETRR